MTPQQPNQSHADITALPGLGQKSAELLARIGVDGRDDLARIGAMTAFRRLRAQQSGISLNLLYALVGALENRDWRSVARERRFELISELETLDAIEAKS